MGATSFVKVTQTWILEVCYPSCYNLTVVPTSESNYVISVLKKISSVKMVSHFGEESLYGWCHAVFYGRAAKGLWPVAAKGLILNITQTG